MYEVTPDPSVRVGFFRTAQKADQATHQLFAAGFSHDEIAVVCPERFSGQIDPGVSETEQPGSGAGTAVVSGAAVGTILGGVGLLAAAAAGLPLVLAALPVLVGGGAIAGGISSLIVSDGYEQGLSEVYDYAITSQKIAVGVEIHDEHRVSKLFEAEEILRAAGAEPFEVNSSPPLTTERKNLVNDEGPNVPKSQKKGT